MESESTLMPVKCFNAATVIRRGTRATLVDRCFFAFTFSTLFN